MQGIYKDYCFKANIWKSYSPDLKKAKPWVTYNPSSLGVVSYFTRINSGSLDRIAPSWRPCTAMFGRLALIYAVANPRRIRETMVAAATWSVLLVKVSQCFKCGWVSLLCCMSSLIEGLVTLRGTITYPLPFPHFSRWFSQLPVWWDMFVRVWCVSAWVESCQQKSLPHSSRIHPVTLFNIMASQPTPP